MTITVQHFLASKDAMERVPKEAHRDLPTVDRHSHAQPHTGWAHRLPMGNPPRRAAGERGGLVRVPKLREPWPATAEQLHARAMSLLERCRGLRIAGERIAFSPTLF